MKSLQSPPQINQLHWQQEGSPSQPQPSCVAIIRKATLDDIWQIYDLYKIVARVNVGNLTQEEDEITLEYISDVLHKGLERGLILVIEKDNKIVGYLKAFTSEFRSLAHVLTNATMIVHPEYQSAGYGGQLLDTYLEQIKSNMPHILRFELFPHQSNQKAIEFYERHGFVQESLAQKKIRHPKGTFEAEETLVWFNPNFSKDALKKYHSFLK
ncbi:MULTISPECIES: GNAT family N-acetyltransferase [Nostoc]|uniref:GNAT family N-acetyltransferase n=1 Tax=Nostoc paludosum FACHB-159 TaxID=2692908 RepID=A0ABR8KK82_9NOSO|nr:MULTISPECIES: GNAT family N-acetyltransferase [Nostoc]MBD2682866.1 GNAT family N-acetyltransferase [Nostoc sp. FACHB-857]MBD2739203.1 GNAT family N-acetyltransferase [Nostoc paludosum FACHB-159]